MLRIASVVAVSVLTSVVSYIFLFDYINNKLSCGESTSSVFNKKKLNIFSCIMITVVIAVSIFAFIYYSNDDVFFAIKRAYILSILWPLCAIDYRIYKIPNKFIIIGLIYRALVFICEVFCLKGSVKEILISDLVAALVLFICSVLCCLIIKNSVGYGDIKLLILIGLTFGINNIWYPMFLSLLIVFLYSIIMLVTKKKSKKDKIPFAPAVMLGTVFSIIAGI